MTGEVHYISLYSMFQIWKKQCSYNEGMHFAIANSLWLEKKKPVQTNAELQDATISRSWVN